MKTFYKCDKTYVPQNDRLIAPGAY